HDLSLDDYQKDSLPDIIQSVYQRENVKEGIAALGKLVMEACDNGDNVAERIVQRNGFKMGESIVCLVKKHFTKEDQHSVIPVVVVGGLINTFDLLRPYIEEVFHEIGLDLKMIVPEMDPVGGAVVAALQEQNIKLSPGFQHLFCYGPNIGK